MKSSGKVEVVTGTGPGTKGRDPGNAGEMLDSFEASVYHKK